MSRSQKQAREAAIAALIASDQANRAGRHTDPAHRQVSAALDAAQAAGCDLGEIHATADCRYGQWLIDNAGR
ncbi:hypothetical protein [Streptomyces sp. NPDC006610]|uniref:hypothetical protein n=1 Tax=Streptomyces sp. NPDC006610 TaxID=3154584 RepID=UPI0033A3C8D0